jgi:hypothetical protein
MKKKKKTIYKDNATNIFNQTATLEAIDGCKFSIKTEKNLSNKDIGTTIFNLTAKKIK